MPVLFLLGSHADRFLVTAHALLVIHSSRRTSLSKRALHNSGSSRVFYGHHSQVKSVFFPYLEFGDQQRGMVGQYF